MKRNAEVARILLKIAFLLEMEETKNANIDKAATKNNNNNAKTRSNISFKARSYRRASDVIATLSSNIDEIYEKEGLDGLLQIPSVGKAIGSKIQEYLTTGRIKYFEEFKSKTTINIDEFYELEGVGPRTIKTLYDNLCIKNLADLERAASEGRLRGIPGISQKKEELILKRIQLFKRSKSRYLIGEIYPLVKQIETNLLNFKGVKKAVAAGSFRRMKETIGDIDYLVVSDDPES